MSTYELGLRLMQERAILSVSQYPSLSEVRKATREFKKANGRIFKRFEDAEESVLSYERAYQLTSGL